MKQLSSSLPLVMAEAEGGREEDLEGDQEMVDVEVEESEEVQMVDTGTVKQWEVVFSRLQSINQESHLLVIDKVTLRL